MKEYIISRSEKEGHIAFYPDRQKIWDFLIQHNCFDDIIKSLKDQYFVLYQKYKSKKDGLIKYHIEWSTYTSQYTVTQLEEFVNSERIPNGNFHVRMIIRTIAKYIVYHIKSNKEETIQQIAKSKQLIKKAITVKKQPKYGIQLLAGGTLGSMFRLYRKNSQKYGKSLEILQKMTIDKSQAILPVQQRSRDKGGLYAIKESFLPAIGCLDMQITENFKKNHGKEIIQVINTYYSLYN